MIPLGARGNGGRATLRELSESSPRALPEFPQNSPRALPELSESSPGTPRELSESSPRTLRALSQSSPRALPELSQNSPRSLPEVSQKSPRTLPELSQSSPRALPELSQSSRRTLPDPRNTAIFFYRGRMVPCVQGRFFHFLVWPSAQGFSPFVEKGFAMCPSKARLGAESLAELSHAFPIGSWTFSAATAVRGLPQNSPRTLPELCQGSPRTLPELPQNSPRVPFKARMGAESLAELSQNSRDFPPVDDKKRHLAAPISNFEYFFCRFPH